MNNKIKLMIILGTRPEIIRLSSIIKKCQKYFETILVNTMQNSDSHLNSVFFENFNLSKPEYTLSIDNSNPGRAMGDIISKTYEIMIAVKPDALLILGDTNSALSVISAKKLKIPIFHMEAGNRSYDLNLPEEINRKIIDEISDINMPYSERARMNLIEEGKRSEYIFKTGSPLLEVIKDNELRLSKSKVLSDLHLSKGSYFLVSIHRNENVSDPAKLKQLFNNISVSSSSFNKQVVLSLHPKTKDIMQRNRIEMPEHYIVSEPFDFFDYIYLQINAFCVISDSGSLAEESNILNFPCVSLRNSTERQEALEAGNFILGNLGSNSLLNAISIAVERNIWNKVDDYQISKVSDVVINVIQSFTEKIKNRY